MPHPCMLLTHHIKSLSCWSAAKHLALGFWLRRKNQSEILRFAQNDSKGFRMTAKGLGQQPRAQNDRRGFTTTAKGAGRQPQAVFPQHRLNFLPLPHGQGSLRPGVPRAAAWTRARIHSMTSAAPAPAELTRHEGHRRGHVAKEVLVPRAEIVQPEFAVRCPRKTMLRALAVAGETDVALRHMRGRESLFAAPNALLPTPPSLRYGFHHIAELVSGYTKWSQE